MSKPERRDSLTWGTGLGALTDANITSTTFGQTTQPLNGARSFFIRTEIKF